MRSRTAPPVVLVISGNDPTGGAGIAADIEAIASIGCQPAPVISALTVQNSHNVIEVYPVEKQLILDQAMTIIEESDIKVLKTGLLGSVGAIEAVHTIMTTHPEITLIVDPILSAGGGKALSDREMIKAITNLLLPLTTVLTPNSVEARKLSDQDSLDEAANHLLNKGCHSLLITGAHEKSDCVNNCFYQQGQESVCLSWERLPYSYHGSGCTLASAIAAFIAQGLSPLKAVTEAQQFTWESLNHGYKTGTGQHQPNRLFWTTNKRS